MTQILILEILLLENLWWKGRILRKGSNLGNWPKYLQGFREIASILLIGFFSYCLSIFLYFSASYVVGSHPSITWGLFSSEALWDWIGIGIICHRFSKGTFDANEWMKEWNNVQMNQHFNKWMNELLNEWMNEWMN